MFIVYATGIWEGGGLAYLNFLSSSYLPSGTIYILDIRVKHSFHPPSGSTCYFFSPSPIGRIHSFLFRHFFLFPLLLLSNSGPRNEFFLNGLPSISRFPFCSTQVYILLQNKLFFDHRVHFEFRQSYRLKLLLLRYWFLLVTQPSDVLITQTQSMQESVSSHFLVSPSFRQITTFLDPPPSSQQLTSTCFSDFVSKAPSFKLFYPASFLSHKNHLRAVLALNLLYASFGPVFTLYCTVSDDNLSSLNIPLHSVVPLGILTREEVFEMYRLSDFLFFPSLCESLGLPLVEAQQFNLPILASALDFVFESCTPRLTFNPYSVTSIFSSLSSLI